MTTFKPTTKTAIIYDSEQHFIGRRRVYEQKGNGDTFVYLNGWIESVYFLTHRKGYTVAIVEE